MSDRKELYWDLDKRAQYWIEWAETGNNDIPVRHYINESMPNPLFKPLPVDKIVQEEVESCKWIFKDDEMTMAYKTSCDNMFQFMNEGVKENHFKYCPYCSKVIEEKQ